jgi:catechol 2,3-dioxygenase-like lactoylglutathione lyase family enzyme
MSVKNALSGIAVKDLEAGKDWYQKLLGRAPDTHPMSEVYEWTFPTGGWIQVFADKERSGKSSVTFVETDFAGRLESLKAAGIETKSLTQSEKINVAIINDPDGNQIIFAQGKHEALR